MSCMYTIHQTLPGPGPSHCDAIRRVGLKITIEGDVGDFLGVRIDRLDDGRVHLSQPNLIDSILLEF